MRIRLPFLLLLTSLSVGSSFRRDHSGKPLVMSKDANPLQKNVERPKWENSTFNQGKCLLCKVLVKHGLKKMKVSKNVTAVLQMVEKMCILLRLEPSDVCKGGIETFGKQVSLVLRQVDLSPEDVCFLAFPDKCSIAALALPTTGDWRVELTDADGKSQTTCGRAQYASRKTIKVLHLTDIHVDFLYDLDGEVSCTSPVCCRSREHERNEAGWSGKAFSIMSKFISSRGSKKALERRVGQWGDYRRCDLPPWTLENMLSTIANGSSSNIADVPANSGHIDYIILTGDLTSHDVWAQTKGGQISALEKLNGIVRKYFPDTKIFPSPGNHDSYPPNNYPPTDVDSIRNLSDPWIYRALADMWSPWLPEQALETVKLGGYYSILVHPGFRIVSLNTNFCYVENWWIYLNPNDPAGMLRWFVEVLAAAEKEGEKVHVIGHIPPGRSPDCLEDWSRNYFRILQRFHCTIVGQFFGHTHFDEIQLFYGEQDSMDPIAVSYIAPSVTPYVDMNPAFRTYELDGSWRVSNHQTYIMDLEEVNRSGKPEWKLEYDARSAFSLRSLSPTEWGKLITIWRNYFEDMRTGEPPISLSRYMKFYSRRLVDFWEGNVTERRGTPHNANLPCQSMSCALKVFCNIVKNKSFKICTH